GAKGVAHIPLLQALDSLHIVPDLIVGNSMGSVMGGLYAMGYSGDSIAKLTKSMDWDKLLGGGVSLDKVSVEEKSEFERYLIGLDIKNGKPTSVSSLLSDQNLREYLSELTYPVYNVTDFDKLSIPFRALATDLVTGKEVVVDSGNLATAIRASMSLPAVFNPVPYKETLLVDGGVVNNFPTDIAQQLGADIIIGSDVGGGMEPKEKLNNFVSVLVQTSMLTSNVKDPEKRKLCTILVDHLPNLKYSTGDFAKSNEIYEEGKIATNQNMDALVTLAEKLKKFKQRTHELPIIPKEFTLDTIVFTNISKENLAFVKERMNIKPHTKYVSHDVVEGINRAMGTNLFSKITTSSFVNDGKIGLELTFYENSKNQVNASLHFDTYRGVGVILNYTGRNILGESSRFLITADIAEQPRARIEYQDIFGSKKDWWWNTELYGENLIQELFIDNKLVTDLKYRSYQFNNQVNKNLNSFKSYIGMSLNYQYTYLKPKADADLTDYPFKSYYFNNIELGTYFSYNDLDKVFFAKNGAFFQAKISRSLLHDIELNFTDVTTPKISGATNGFTKLGLTFEKRIPFQKKLTGIIGATTNFIFEDSLKSDELSFSSYGYGAKYFLGGTSIGPTSNRTVFPGLNEDELTVTQLMKANVGLQINLIGKIYLTPHVDIASVGFRTFDDYMDDAFSPKGKWQDRTDTSFLFSGGANISYLSLLGPITFDASWVNDIDETNLYFSIGFVFNPS
ncbi:MAG TPA: patatin-like phospholipase family protein, partial [Flavobacterium sp.]|nr:patatin-like phospholipase family protein [Flavobacterium sp.]